MRKRVLGAFYEPNEVGTDSENQFERSLLVIKKKRGLNRFFFLEKITN